MDKYDIVLDLVGHPDKYTSERIEEILSDNESKEIYNLLCKTGSAFTSRVDEEDMVDVESAWEQFSRNPTKRESCFLWGGSRAASIAAVVLTSLAAVAIGVTMAVKSFGPKPHTVEVSSQSYDVSAASAPNSIILDSVAIVDDIAALRGTILFEDAPLEEILSRIEGIHGVTVEYKNPETAQLHLYYKLDPELPLKETVEQLNTFEQIDIRINGNKIVVD